jgi:uncharacterized membrane protein YbhN (UPF0104 family)
MATKNYYDLLGVSRGASLTEIASAYKRKTSHTHDQQQLQAIEEAYDVLSNEEKRKQYNSQFTGPFDPSDLYLVEDLETITEENKPKTLKDTLWSIAKLILKVAVTGLLLYYVFSKVKIEQLKGLFSKADLRYMLLALLCFALSTIVSASRLLSFFKSIDLKLSVKFNLRLYMLGMFYNLCLPGGIGGDGYKIYLLNKRYKLPAKKVFWAILFDRLSGFWAIGLITVFLAIFIPQINMPIVLPGIALILGTALYYFIARRFFKDYTRFFVEAHAKAVVVQSLQVATIIMVLLSLHFNGKFSPYLLTFLASSLAAIFPFTLGGLGAREFIFTHFADFFHMDTNIAVFLSLSFYVVSAIVSLLGVYYVFNTKRLEEGLPPAE